MFLVALVGGDEIEHVRIFEGLLGKLALRIGQRAGEVRYAAGKGLPLIKMQVKLVIENGFGPSVLNDRLPIPFALSARFGLVEKLHDMAPGNFAVGTAKFRTDLTGKFRHIAQIAPTHSLDAGKCRTNIFGQRVYEAGAVFSSSLRWQPMRQYIATKPAEARAATSERVVAISPFTCSSKLR